MADDVQPFAAIGSPACMSWNEEAMERLRVTTDGDLVPVLHTLAAELRTRLWVASASPAFRTSWPQLLIESELPRRIAGQESFASQSQRPDRSRSTQDER
jgi:hypothetical protein